MGPHLTEKWRAKLPGFPLKSSSPAVFLGLFPSTWNSTSGTREERSRLLQFRTRTQQLHFPVSLTHTCGMTSQKPQQQQIKLQEKKYSQQVSKETFLCLLNFIRNSQAETIGHCSPAIQYSTSVHSLKLPKASSVFECSLEPVILRGAAESLEPGQ